jgi:hypothetical protein
MPTKSNKSDKSAAAQTTSKGKGKDKKGGAPPPTAGADPPIIVDGGGSIGVDIPPKFTDLGGPPGGGKKFKHGLGNLTSMEILRAGSCTVDPATGKITITLNRTSYISVNYS